MILDIIVGNGVEVGNNFTRTHFGVDDRMNDWIVEPSSNDARKVENEITGGKLFTLLSHDCIEGVLTNETVRV